jgi:putative heme iron utilization protein
MNISAAAAVNLLHRSPIGTLATHSREPQGYPYPTALPFAPDARHRPVILVSRLAEHARNLDADSRAGFLVVHASEDDVLNGERVTLIGRFVSIEASPPLVRRYLRYHPEAERYLALGDFSFYVLEIERLRYIGGFGTMGWLDGAELDALTPLGEEDEIALIEQFEGQPRHLDAMKAAGIDRYGIDLKVGACRRRISFDSPKTNMVQLERAVAECVVDQAD